jgi:hypothetical protein
LVHRLAPDFTLDIRSECPLCAETVWEQDGGIAQTVSCGGDTDTNAAIAGALLGAAFGADAFPSQWVDRLLTCRPMNATQGCRHPRPQAFWPVDCLILAERLAWLGSSLKAC